MPPAGSFCGGNKSAEWNFERAGADIDIVIAARRGVQVDAVHADTDTVGVMHRAAIAAHGKRQILFDHRGQGTNATAFTDIGRHGEAMLRAGNVAAQAQTRKTLTTIRARRFGLHPVEHGIDRLAASASRSAYCSG